MQEPNTLSAQILKAVYYPSDDFLSAQLGSRPSQIWRSILEGREVLKQGLIRRIGNGQTTNMWNDNWLPRPNMMRPLAALKENKPEMVSELVDEGARTWNVQMLQEHLLPMDVMIVRRIPLPSTNFEDTWAWSQEKSGNFSVRSAYRMLIDTRNRREAWLDGRPGNSDPAREEKAWAKLWKYRIPSKLRIFAWRLARQSLPTADVAHHRTMAPTNMCSICGWKEDSWRHSLLECRMARCVWVLLDEDLYDRVKSCTEPGAKNWLFVLEDMLTEVEYVKLIVSLWAIWKARRDVIHEDVFQSPFATCSFISNFLHDLSSLDDSMKKMHGGSRAHLPSKWIAPPMGCVKGNVDGAICSARSKCAAAAIFRDDNGVFQGASALVMEGIIEPACVEAMACREALCLAQDLQVASAVIACDSSGVVRSISDGSQAENSMLIKEIRRMMDAAGEVQFRYERRECNIDAHNIARSSLELSPGRHVWLLEPPDYVNITVVE